MHALLQEGMRLIESGKSRGSQVSERVGDFRGQSVRTPSNAATPAERISTAARQLELGNWRKAECCFQEALAHKPDYAMARNHLGNPCVERSRLDEAESSYARALASGSNYAEAHTNRALVWQLHGRFSEGWEEQEWRRRHPLAEEGALRVGLVGAGNPGHRNDRHRSISPELLCDLFQTEGVDSSACRWGALFRDCWSLKTKSLIRRPGSLITQLRPDVYKDTSVAHPGGRWDGRSDC